MLSEAFTKEHILNRSMDLVHDRNSLVNQHTIKYIATEYAYSHRDDMYGHTACLIRLMTRSIANGVPYGRVPADVKQRI